MHIIAALPGLFALIVALRRGPAMAYLHVYLPVLFLLPDYYRWYAPGLPDPSFHHAAIIPIAAVWMLRGLGPWRFSAMDLVVLLFAFLIGLSEYLAAGYKEAQNLIIDLIAAVILPYFLSKGLIVPHGLTTAVGKRIVLLLFAVSVISLWEFKMAYTPWARILDPFFPGQNNWVTTFRWGFTRIAGPYGHAILAGIILVVGYRLQRWLQVRRHWGEGRSDRRKAQILTLGMIGGVIMTMVKGAWLGAAAGAAVMVIGRSKRPGTMLIVIAVSVVVLGIPGFLWLKSWAGVGRLNAKTETQETAAYRWELMEKYWDVAMEHAALGWGRNTWPKIPGMPSIDNYYLLLVIMHGLPVLLLFWFTFFWMGIRLMLRGIRAPPGSEIRVLTFTLASVYAVYFAALATVFLGSQTVQFLFIVTGWAEGLLVYGMREPRSDGAPSIVEDKRPFRFVRVLR